MTRQVDPDKFARLSARLSRKTDRGERGQRLPATEAALATPGEEAARLEALVAALARERIIVPVPVETHPESGGAHRPHDLDGQTLPPLPTDVSRAGPAVVVFTSATQLARWDGAARPLPVSAQKAALTAVATGVARLWVDPAGAGLLIPGPAVHALAHGGDWLPPWQDTALRDDLCRAAFPSQPVTLKRVVISPLNDRTGGIRVEATLGLPERIPPAQRQRAVKEALGVLASNPRLRASADRIEFVPLLAEACE